MALHYPKDMGTEWMNLKQDVKNAFTSANSRVPYQKIGAGILQVFQSIQVQPGAFLSFKFTSGVTGVYFGPHTVGGDPVEGMIFRRGNNSLAMWIYSRISDNYGFTAIYDQNTNIIISDDGVSKKGLGRPWIPHTFADTLELASPPANRQTTGTTDVAVVSTLTPIQHSNMRLIGYVYTATTATVNVKVKDLTTGTTLLDVTQVSGYLIESFLVPDYDFGEDHQLDITIRRASGSGAVGFTAIELMGRQS